MGWVNSHSTGKVWEKTSIPKLWGSQIFHVKQKPMQFPNHGMREFPYSRTSMGKHGQFPGSAIPCRFKVKGTLMQIGKSPYMFVFI